jgi:hypothetical protein
MSRWPAKKSDQFAHGHTLGAIRLFRGRPSHLFEFEANMMRSVAIRGGFEVLLNVENSIGDGLYRSGKVSMIHEMMVLW